MPSNTGSQRSSCLTPAEARTQQALASLAKLAAKVVDILQRGIASQLLAVPGGGAGFGPAGYAPSRVRDSSQLCKQWPQPADARGPSSSCVSLGVGHRIGGGGGGLGLDGRAASAAHCEPEAFLRDLLPTAATRADSALRG